MSDIVTYITFAAELPRVVAWGALFGAFIIWVSGRRGWAFAGASLALIAAALAIAGLPGMAHDPIAWGALVGGIFLGVGTGWPPSRVWGWAWVLPVCVLSAAFSLYIFKQPSADAEALILIVLAGSSVGDWLSHLIAREARSA